MARSNLYLTATLIFAFGLASCNSPEKERQKELSQISLHIETHQDNSPFSAVVPILRTNSVMVTVSTTPFLNEENVVRADVVDTAGGHAIQLQFDHQGSVMLESVTSANKGRRIAVMAKFAETRWLAAPVIAARNTNGVFFFTPDASHEESERIVRGLNHLAQKEKRQPKPPKSEK